MIPDKNKSDLTRKITEGASIYLEGRNFKPIETEVYVDRGWIADLAGVCTPNQTVMQKIKLIPQKPRWDYRSYYKDGKPTEEYEQFREKMNEWNSTYKNMKIPELLTVLLEIKISRSDFSQDHKWDKPSPTNLKYLAIPSGMLKKEEYPHGWFVLECNKNGGVRKCVQVGDLSHIEAEKQMWTLYSIAQRRHYRTEYAWHRDLQKQAREYDAERKSITRMANAVRAVLSIAKGVRNTEDSLRWHGIKHKLPTYLMEELNQIEGALKNLKD